jgi:hypothetical protein
VHWLGEATLLAECIKGKGPEERLFTREIGRDDNRRTVCIGDFRKTWWSVCTKAGVGQTICHRCSQPVTGPKCEDCKSRNLKYVGLLFHDLWRTAARNYRRLGVGETVIMRIGDWKTRSVFERYNIVTQADVLDAVTKLEKSEVQKAKTARKNSPRPNSGTFRARWLFRGKIRQSIETLLNAAN